MCSEVLFHSREGAKELVERLVIPQLTMKYEKGAVAVSKPLGGAERLQQT